MTETAKAQPSQIATGKRFRWVVQALFCVLLMALMPLVASAAANTLTVNTLTDSSDTASNCLTTTGGTCSLRDAITQANTDNAGDTINFGSLTGTITLTSALPAIAANVTIAGPAANQLAISGAGSYQIFVINSGVTAAAISGLTITNGLYSASSYDSGGGIFNAGVLTVTNCTISNNSSLRFGGGIYNAGTSSSSFGTLTVTGSTFIGNSSQIYGGGIYNAGVATVTNSTFTGNSAPSASNGTGGAIANGFATWIQFTITNSTISGNSATNSDAGIYGFPTLVNNIITDDVLGGVPSGQGNVTAGVNLSPLGYYGGTTQTMIPLPGSAAICAGLSSQVPSGVTTDERGFALDPSCATGSVDAGAVQTNQLQVNTLADSTHSGATCVGSAACSLRDAITLAEASTTGVDITFLPSLVSAATPGTITVGSGLEIYNTKGHVNILGPGLSSLSISGNNTANIFQVDINTQALFYGLTITKGSGGIKNSGTLTVLDSTVSGNTGFSGGGIYNDGTLTVLDSTVSGNTATGSGYGVFGGGIYTTSILTVSNSTISGNNGNSYGGGIYVKAGTATVTSSTISNNTSTSDGGGIFINGGTTTVTNSTVSGNSSAWAGGIYINPGSTLALANSIVGGNTATGVVADMYAAGTYTNNGGNLAGTDSSKTSKISANLALLGNYGGPTQTMVPLPGSPAICAGESANIVSGVVADQRGYPNTNTSYTSGSTCVDAGAVQSHYTGVKWVTQPTDTAVNAVISAPTVAVIETNPNASAPNNTDAVNGVPVTITYSGGASEIAGTLTQTTSGGVATFGGLTANTAVNGATLSTTVIPVTGSFDLPVTASSDFNVYGSTTQLVVSAPSTVTAGTAVSVTVTAEDAHGSPVLNDTDLVNVYKNELPNQYFGGEADMSNGVITFTMPGTLFTTAETTSVYAIEPLHNTIAGTSGTITVVAAAPAIVVSTGGTSQSTYVNTAYSSPLAVTVQDAYGNTVGSGVVVNFAVPATGASAVLSASNCTTDVTSSCSVTAKANGTASATAYTVTASVVGGTSPASFSLTNLTLPKLVVTTSADDAGSAANCTVQTSSTSGTDAACSLRDAVAEANTLGAAAIYFDNTKFATAKTITLINGQLPTITGSTFIYGPGSTLLTIDASGESRIFNVYSTSFYISGLTLANGNASGGGAITVGQSGDLTVSNSAFKNNTSSVNGGAIALLDSSLTITNSTFTGNTATGTGGAISFDNEIGSITGSTFTNNSATGIGGAIYNYHAGDLTVTNSTFNTNTSNGYGGAIYNNKGTTLTVAGSTFNGNTAPVIYGGAIFNDGTASVTNSTFTANTSLSTSNSAGGAFFNANDGLLTVVNSTISGNSAGDGAGLFNYSPYTGSVVLVNDLIPDSISEQASGSITYTGGNIFGSANLSALYGGPTQTLIPEPGSSAICAGLVTGLGNDATGAAITLPTTDQRGFPRVSSYANYTNGSCVDAGAVQTHYSIAFTTQPPASIETGTAFTSANAPVVTLYETRTSSAFTAGTGTLNISSAPSATTAVSASTLGIVAGLASFSGLDVTSTTTNSGVTLAATLPLNATLAAGLQPSLTVTSSPFEVVTLVLANATLSGGTVGVSYSTAVTATGGVGAISYAVTSGSLPAGLSLSTAGAITGTPTTASTTAVTFSITATDSSSNTATGVFTIAIAKGTPTVKVTLTSGSNPSFIDNAVTFKATVADAGNTPSGTVTFYDGSTQICSATVTLVSGAASCTVNNNANPLPAGANSISASYSGDTNFVAVANTASTLFAETLEDFTISAASSAITVIPNYTGVFTATIAPLSPATTLPGSVALSYTSSPAFPSDWTVTFSQTSVASGSGSTAVTMNIQTALTTAKNGSLASRVAPFSLALLLLPFAGLLRKSGKRFGRMVSLLLLAAAGVVAMAGVSGCNQSGFFGQAPVTYTVTINGSAGSSATGILSHNANTVTLTVE